jgi:hypothetical protein
MFSNVSEPHLSIESMSAISAESVWDISQRRRTWCMF